VHNTPTVVAPTTPTAAETTTSPVPPQTSAPPDTTPATSPDTSSSEPTSTAATTSSAPPPPGTTCKSLTVRVLPGGASFGEQIAGLDFVNDSHTTCMLVGYPTVTLLLNGQVIGRPSEPSSPAKSTRTLRPGQVAESLLHDYTQTCQAPLSDSVRVRVPGTRKTITRPGMQLRACVLRVDRLTAPE
jgi:Protein of unknown function (DUF4232)